MSPDAPSPVRGPLAPVGRAAVRERALEVFGERYLVGRLFPHLLPANRRASGSGGWDQEAALGHGRAEVEGHLEDRALIVRVGVVERIGRRSAQLGGTSMVWAPRKTRRVISGVDPVGGT